MGGQYIEPMPPSWTTSQCEVCRRGSAARLCDACRAEHAGPALRCGRCALRLPSPEAVCAGCTREEPALRRTVCAVDYGFPWDRLVAGFKFQGQPELAGLMVELLHRAAPADAADDLDLLAPVPLSAPRLAERGYDQAWELARRLARRLQRPARCGLLERRVGTERQTALGRDERRANLRGAFQVPASRMHDVHGRRVALVDDVMTTGATAGEAARTLLQAGAASVELWVFARTPAG